MSKYIFFLLYIIASLLIFIFIGGGKSTDAFFPLITLIFIRLGENFYINKTKYYRILTALICGFSSILFIVNNVGNMPSVIKVSSYLVYMSFVSSIALLFIIISSSIIHFKTIFSTIGLLILFLPILILWGYYLSSGAWLSVESCMAILQTNPAEARDYISDHLSFIKLLAISLGIICVIFIGKYVSNLKIYYTNRKICIFVSIFILLNMVFIYRTRENVVTNIVYDTKAYASAYNDYLISKQNRQDLLAKMPEMNLSSNKGVYVLVIGESETRDHMGVYGYGRDTTPWLSSKKYDPNFIIFNKSWSCAADTVSALTYVLTAKNQYNTINLKDAYSLIEIANAAGYDTVWLSNQVQYGLADTPITAIASSAKQQIWIHNKVGNLKDGRYLDMPDYYDEKIIPEIDNINFTDKMLIVIHLMGSHNSYKVRYPENYSVYDDSSDMGEDEKNTAEYDNSIRYTDYILDEIYSRMKNVPEFKAMVYFSDHGEGIDAHVGHDINRFNHQMTRIPFFVYLSDSYIKQYRDKYNILLERKDTYFTNDLIFNIMLDLMNIHSDEIDEPNNTFSSKSYDADTNRFKTLYGRYNLEE